MQVAAQNTEQVLGRHLGLLLHLHVGERVVVHQELHTAVLHVALEVDLIAEVSFETGEIRQVQAISDRRRIQAARDGGHEQTLRALERTPRQALRANVVASREQFADPVDALRLVGARAVVVGGQRVADLELHAAARVHGGLLFAIGEAGLLRVGEAC